MNTLWGRRIKNLWPAWATWGLEAKEQIKKPKIHQLLKNNNPDSIMIWVFLLLLLLELGSCYEAHAVCSSWNPPSRLPGAGMTGRQSQSPAGSVSHVGWAPGLQAEAHAREVKPGGRTLGACPWRGPLASVTLFSVSLLLASMRWLAMLHCTSCHDSLRHRDPNSVTHPHSVS